MMPAANADLLFWLISVSIMSEACKYTDYVLSYLYRYFIHLYPLPHTDLSSSGEPCTPLSGWHSYTVSYSSKLVLSLPFCSSYYLTKDQRATEWSYVRAAQWTPHTKAALQRVERRASYWKMFPSFQSRVCIPHPLEATKLFDIVSEDSLGDGLHESNEHIIFEHSNLKAFIKKQLIRKKVIKVRKLIKPAASATLPYKV